MLDFISEFKIDRSTLIGRPYLQFKNTQCGNIVCGKKDKFKKYKENIFQCECGYTLKGNYEIEQKIMPKLTCSTPNNCPEHRTKMTKDCLSCTYIKER